MGHIAHLRNQFKSIHTFQQRYGYIIFGAEKTIISFLRIECSIFVKPWVLFNKWHFVPSLVKIGTVLLEKKIIQISLKYLCYFLFISSLKRVWPFIWTNLNPLHQRMLCAKFGLNWPSGSGEEYENVKSLLTDGQTDDGRQAIRIS